MRFGLLEYMDKTVQQVSVQHLKDMERHSPQFKESGYDDLVYQVCNHRLMTIRFYKIGRHTFQQKTLELKITALNLNKSVDNAAHLKALEKQLYVVKALLERFNGLERKKLKDSTTFILNSCDIICTTLGSIPLLQK